MEGELRGSLGSVHESEGEGLGREEESEGGRETNMQMNIIIRISASHL